LGRKIRNERARNPRFAGRALALNAGIFLEEKILRFAIEWGKITFDGSAMRDILFVEGKVTERNRERLEAKYGTNHLVDVDEAKILLKGHPAEVIIGNGFEGLLKLDPEAESALKQKTALTVLASPQAVDMLNEKIKRGERVNALIHTTC